MIEVVDLLYKNPHELIKTPNQEESMKHLLLEEVINGATVNPQLQQDIYDLISVPEPEGISIQLLSASFSAAQKNGANATDVT